MKSATERVTVWVVCALLLLVLFAFDPSLSPLDRYLLPKEAALAVGGVLLFVLAALLRRGRPLDGVDALLVVWLLVELVSSTFVLDGEVALRSTTLTAAGVSLALAVRACGPESRRFVGIFALCLLAGAALLVCGEAYALVPRLAPTGFAPGFTLGHRNNAAHLFAVAIPVLSGVVLSGRLRTAALAACAFAVCVSATLLTRSRAAWLAAAVGTSVTLGCAYFRAGRRPQLRARAGWLLLAIAAGGALPILVRPKLNWRTAHPYADTFAHLLEFRRGSGHGRLTQWCTSLRLLPEALWFGLGPGHWAIYYPKVSEPGDRTVKRGSLAPVGRLMTNDWLSWLLERGAIGAGVLFALVVVAARRDAAACDPEDGRAQPSRIGAWGALCTVAWFDCFIRVPTGMVVFALLMPEDRPLRAVGGQSLRWARVLRFGAGLVVLVSLRGAPRALERVRFAHRVASQAPAGLDDWLARDPTDVALRSRIIEMHMARGECARALPHIEALLRVRPYLPRARAYVRACSRSVPEP